MHDLDVIIMHDVKHPASGTFGQTRLDVEPEMWAIAISPFPVPTAKRASEGGCENLRLRPLQPQNITAGKIADPAGQCIATEMRSVSPAAASLVAKQNKSTCPVCKLRTAQAVGHTISFRDMPRHHSAGDCQRVSCEARSCTGLLARRRCNLRLPSHPPHLAPDAAAAANQARCCCAAPQQTAVARRRGRR